MTDKELIQVYRECSRHPRCEGCPMDTTEREKDCPASWFDPDDMVNRMESLLAENDRLWDSARRLWAGTPRYCGDLPRFAMHADELPSTEGGVE